MKRRREEINDLDSYVANYWRAVKWDPEGVARAADWPAVEADLHVRHAWLKQHGPSRLARLATDPFAFDAQIAGWWAWGLCLWTGKGWCSSDSVTRAHLSHRRGINTATSLTEKIAWLNTLSARLRDVGVANGPWRQALEGAAVARSHSVGVFMDPPYRSDLRDRKLYRTDVEGVSDDVEEWCVLWGKRPNYRIVLAGLAGEHRMPFDWRTITWKGNRTWRGRGNALDECLWFSPNCEDISKHIQLRAAVADG